MISRQWFGLALATLTLGSCAAIERYEGVLPKPDETLVHAYHSVRDLGATTAHAGGLVFCATRNGLEAVRSEGRSSEQWSDKLDDTVVQDYVRRALRTDPALRHEVIRAKVLRGQAFLYGKLASDHNATLAVYDALEIIGVGVVNAAFITPDSPTPMDVRATGACY